MVDAVQQDPDQRELERQIALQKVALFERRFGRNYRLLAYHAALPLVLTPELVHYLRTEFLLDLVPWEAEADLLLSDLCSQVGYELYAMDTAVRAYLLEQMQQDDRIPPDRMQSIAQVLMSYVLYLSHLNPGLRERELQVQRWAAMAYMGNKQCRQMADEIAQQFEARGKQGNSTAVKAEFARLARITQELEPQLQAYPQLIEFARRVGQVLQSSDSLTQGERQKIVVVGKHRLQLPGEQENDPDLKVLNFITAQLVESYPLQSQVVDVVTIVFNQTSKDSSSIPENSSSIKIQNLRQFTVQIRHTKTQEIVGTGVVISQDGKIVSAAHVVVAAGVNPRSRNLIPNIGDVFKGFSGEASPSIEGEVAEIPIYFPQARDSQKREQVAVVFQALDDFDDDIVLLQLKAETLPEGVGVAIIDTAEDSVDSLENRRFRSYGYRRLANYQGLSAEGIILGFVEYFRELHLQNEVLQLQSPQIGDGMSGAAVLDLVRNRVVGIITAISDEGVDRDTVFATDLAVLTKPPFNLAIPENQSNFTLQRQQHTVQFFLERLADEIGIEMLLIPAGTFMMGSPKDEIDRLSYESPQHEVNVPPFFMGKYPITQAQWRFVAELPQVNRELNPDPSRFKGDKRPVEQVSWYEAVEFCDRLSTHTGQEYRLPTEAEWEYACRAGTTTPFHFGETITTDLANYDGTDDPDGKWSGSYGRGPKGEYRKETTPVDRFGIANAFGLCDMHGNVCEWCFDQWHENYEGAPTNGNAWLADGDETQRVIRGGSWSYNPEYCRSAYRFDLSPDNRLNSFGFRVVCVAPSTL